MGDKVLFWGWPMCTRSTYRFIEHYEKFPLLIRSIQKYTPFFKSGYIQPRVEAQIETGISQLQMGCGFVSVIDSSGKVWTWGDNYGSQLATKDDIHREEPCLIKSIVDKKIVQMSLGFQHSLYLSSDGEVFGVGKNNRFQLGKKFNEYTQNEEIFDRYQTCKQLDYFDERVVKVAAGKFHSLFLTESGKLFGLGYNQYGQLGISNSLYLHAEEPVEIFTDGIKIKDFKCGAHHTLLMSEEGELFGFGARMNGQLDGLNYDGREEQCSIMQVPLPESIGNKKIISFDAKNLRSNIITEDNQVWFWGGYFYDGS